MFRTLPMSPIAPGSLRSFVRGLAPAAWYQFGTGITVVGAGVDTWADQSGNARDLLQATDTNRPTLNADGSITFDGVDNFIKTAAFTLNQPETIYFLGAQVTWTNNDYVYDGDTATNSGLIFQSAVTPNLQCHAGLSVALADSPALDTDCVLTVVFNGASSLIQRNNGTASTGDAGAGNMGGFTLGSRGNGGSCSNIRVKEAIIFAAAHDAAIRARVIRYLMQVGQVA